MRALIALASAASIALLWPPLHGAAQTRPHGRTYVVIANPSCTVATIDRKFIEDAFLKKITQWPDGQSVRPVDLIASSPVRRSFTDDVMGRSVEAVKGYWQQRIFSGRDVPPPELNTDDEVVQYVLRHSGALGYVSSGAHLDGAKVLVVD